MTEVLEDIDIRVLREDEDGALVHMQDHYASDFGNFIPLIGDEIPCPMSWNGDGKSHARNGFLVVKRRVHLYSEDKIVLVCSYRNATAHDYDIH